MKNKRSSDWKLEVITIELDENWNPEDDLEICDRCGSGELAIETSGPLTGWGQCLSCKLYYPNIEDPNAIVESAVKAWTETK